MNATEDELRRVTELIRARGLEISELQELQRRKLPRAAVPALIVALPEVNEVGARLTIVCALTDPVARGLAAKPLIRELARAKLERNERLAWQIGNALCVVADDSVSEDLLTASRDPDLEGGHQTILEAMSRVRKRPEIVARLREALGERAVAGHAVRALGKLGAYEARSDVERFLGDEMPWIRKEAKKALERMDRAEATSTRRQ